MEKYEIDIDEALDMLEEPSSLLKEDRQIHPTPIQGIMKELREERKRQTQSPEPVINSEEMEKRLDQLEKDVPSGYCCYDPEDSYFQYPSEEPEKPIDPELQRRIREMVKELRERRKGRTHSGRRRLRIPRNF